jgi:TRAP-type mannitol/chloroaromatic compound transport system permease large subunit
VLSDIMQLSVGTLFAAAVGPGLLLAAVYCIYIIVFGMLYPDKVPPLPKDERDAVSVRELWTRFFKVVVPPVLLVFSVLGSIIGGVAAPTEAAAMGAIGAMLVTIGAGRFSFKALKEATEATAKITAVMLFILVCAQIFALAFRGLNGEDLIHDLFEFIPGGVTADIIFLMVLIFLLCLFLEWIEISSIAVPLFLPVVISQDDQIRVPQCPRGFAFRFPLDVESFASRSRLRGRLQKQFRIASDVGHAIRDASRYRARCSASSDRT